MTTLKLLLMALLWGGTFIAGRTVAQEVAPLPAAFYRFLIATAALWVTVRLVQERLPRLTVGQWLGVSLLGLNPTYRELHGNMPSKPL